MIYWEKKKEFGDMVTLFCLVDVSIYKIWMENDNAFKNKEEEYFKKHLRDLEND